MSHDLEIKIIKAVKQNPCLYNSMDIGFRSALKRGRAWSRVSDACGLTVRECEHRWKNMRDRFVKLCHRHGAAELENTKNLTRRNFFNEIKFLKRHIRTRVENIKNDNEESNSDEAPESKVRRQENLASDRSNEGGHLSETADLLKIIEHAAATIHSDSEDEEPSSLSIGESAAPSNSNCAIAQAKFVEVMNLIENVLEKLNDKLPASAGTQSDPEKSTSIDMDMPPSPFYSYLDSILNQVDLPTRSDIQLKLLTLANEQVKRAGADSNALKNEETIQ
ncbi:transcription factor Adf-1 [Drosophila obscura]|uniref:transcription factor Adf-1 n=1 Tax=Drosophila obscura TaxID=7282 RepID=UPI001BB237CC|nr:transcription factor Adf-1 [Drosophila obscura]